MSRRAPRPFTLPHFRAWAHGLTLDTEDTWEVEGFQGGFVRDVFTGVPEAWLIVPEENSKTTTIAGLALYHAEFRPNAAVMVADSSRDQAEIMYRQADGFVERSDLSGFRCYDGYRRIVHKVSGSRIQVLAADDRTGDGIIPTL